MVTAGSGDYIYEPVENWAQLPPGWSFREIGGIGVDSKDNVYVFNRGEHPMMVFNRDGGFLRALQADEMALATASCCGCRRSLEAGTNILELHRLQIDK